MVLLFQILAPSLPLPLAIQTCKLMTVGVLLDRKGAVLKRCVCSCFRVQAESA